MFGNGTLSDFINFQTMVGAIVITIGDLMVS